MHYVLCVDFTKSIFSVEIFVVRKLIYSSWKRNGNKLIDITDVKVKIIKTHFLIKLTCIDLVKNILDIVILLQKKWQNLQGEDQIW